MKCRELMQGEIDKEHGILKGIRLSKNQYHEKYTVRNEMHQALNFISHRTR
jgi:hypothetical protein